MQPFSTAELAWLAVASKQLGFLDMRPVALGPEPGFTAFSQWLAAGHHGRLDYMERHPELRADSSRLGQNLLSALVFLAPCRSEWHSLHVARYARSKLDYHTELRFKLQELSAAFQKTWRVIQHDRICIDTAPLLERSLAERSGLGWIGKNGCLISRQHGSFTLLANWLVSIPHENKTIPHAFHCGTCTRCLNACPTDAFVAPGMLAADRCLSTQTIENRSLIEPHFHEHMKSMVFGCDICQDVCPWNRRHPPVAAVEALPPLHELLELSEPEFRSYFRGKALQRPGWHGLRRNFLIAAGWDDSVASSLFTRHLYHSNSVVRKTARQILERRRKIRALAGS